MRPLIPTALTALATLLAAGGCVSADPALPERITALEQRVTELEARNDALEEAVEEVAQTPPPHWIPSAWPVPTNGDLPLWIPDLRRIDIPHLEVTPSEPGDCVLPLPEPLRLELR